MNDQYEFSGKTVEDAIADGLIHLSLNREQVDVEILNKGSRGILGFGSEASVVRIIPRTADAAPPEPPAAEIASTPAPTTRPPGTAEPDIEPVSEIEEAQTSTLSDDGALVGAVAEDDDDDYDDEITDDELGEMAVDLLEEMISLMGLDANVTAMWKDPEPGDNERCLQLDVHGNDLAVLIGRNGETLSSVQFLLRLMVNQKIHAWQNIVVDVENYKSKRADQLVQMAERMAAQVAETARAMSLESMPSNERRIIHLALRDHPDVYTESSGDSERRKVHIIPKD